MKKILLSFIGSFLSLTIYAQQLSIDSTFNVDGKVTTDFGFLNDHASAMVIQADGKCIVGGKSSYMTYSSGYSFARYTTNGF